MDNKQQIKEEKEEYKLFVKKAKKLLRMGALIDISGLNEQDQAFFDASMAEPADGAFCD